MENKIYFINIWLFWASNYFLCPTAAKFLYRDGQPNTHDDSFSVDEEVL